jgi:hypothetical protein
LFCTGIGRGSPRRPGDLFQSSRFSQELFIYQTRNPHFSTEVSTLVAAVICNLLDQQRK